MSFNMTKEKREAFLADLHVGVVGVAAASRGPYLFPVWYLYEPGGDIEFLTNKDAKKLDLLKNTGRFSLLVQDENPPYKYVSVEGPIVSMEDANHEIDLAPIARRYLGDEGGDEYVEETAGDEEVLIRMRPERWSSADYG
jgi:PPOX class probable F420-dependent enzyme